MHLIIQGWLYVWKEVREIETDFLDNFYTKVFAA